MRRVTTCIEKPPGTSYSLSPVLRTLVLRNVICGHFSTARKIDAMDPAEELPAVSCESFAAFRRPVEPARRSSQLP